jgi:hypothetical protein
MRPKRPLQHRPKRKRTKAKTYHFQLTTPGSGSVLDVAENAMIDSAIRKATTGGTR